jgi:arsenical pump membrane protein
MTAILIVTSISIVGMFLAFIFFQKIKIGNYELSTFRIVPFLGAIVLLAFNLIDGQAFFSDLVSDSRINPFEILLIFFSMTFISVALDEAGFFSYLAYHVAKIAKVNQFVLFFSFYALIAIITVFASNDVVILTMTPFIIFLCKNSKINPIPYIVSEFICSNTWSMLLIIGNPTNIYIASFFDISFIEYFEVMIIPTILASLTSLAIMFFLFYKDLKQPIYSKEYTKSTLDRGLAYPLMAILLSCIAILIASSYIDLPMWIISASFAAFSLLFLIIYTIFKHSEGKVLLATLIRLPYELIPFVIAMFAIVFSLNALGVTEWFADVLGDGAPLWSYGFSSLFMSDILNNIPLSVFYSEVIAKIADKAVALKATYATIIGSNLGAYLTPVGALAGIIWSKIVKDLGVEYSFKRFVINGTIIAIPTLVFSLLGLLLVL